MGWDGMGWIEGGVRGMDWMWWIDFGSDSGRFPLV